MIHHLSILNHRVIITIRLNPRIYTPAIIKWESSFQSVSDLDFDFFREKLCKCITIAIGAKKRLHTTACFTSNWLKFFGGLKFKNFRSVEDSNVLIVSKSIFQMNTIFTVQSVFHISFLSFELMMCWNYIEMTVQMTVV